MTTILEKYPEKELEEIYTPDRWVSSLERGGGEEGAKVVREGG